MMVPFLGSFHESLTVKVPVFGIVVEGATANPRERILKAFVL